jgi:hypothetical protein
MLTTVSANSSALLIASSTSSKLLRSVQNSQLRNISGFEIIALLSLATSPSSSETWTLYDSNKGLSCFKLLCLAAHRRYPSEAILEPDPEPDQSTIWIEALSVDVMLLGGTKSGWMKHWGRLEKSSALLSLSLSSSYKQHWFSGTRDFAPLRSDRAASISSLMPPEWQIWCQAPPLLVTASVAGNARVWSRPRRSPSLGNTCSPFRGRLPSIKVVIRCT